MRPRQNYRTSAAGALRVGQLPQADQFRFFAAHDVAIASHAGDQHNGVIVKFKIRGNGIRPAQIERQIRVREGLPADSRTSHAGNDDRQTIQRLISLRLQHLDGPAKRILETFSPVLRIRRRRDGCDAVAAAIFCQDLDGCVG